MLTVFVRTAILYSVSVIAIRLMGKREVGQLQPYEFVLALMIAELAAAPMEGIGAPLLHGIVPILGMLALHGLMTLLTAKFPFMQRLLSGGPSVIIREGALQYDEMRRMCYTVSDLTEEMRQQGYLDIAQIYTAILETSGKLSVFPRSASQPATRKDLGLHAPEEGIPLTLVVDGQIQHAHLLYRGFREDWLRKTLAAQGYGDISQVLVASLDSQSMLFVQEKGKGKKPRLFPILQEKEA